VVAADVSGDGVLDLVAVNGQNRTFIYLQE
jgi:hypothetical protein